MQWLQPLLPVGQLTESFDCLSVIVYIYLVGSFVFLGLFLFICFMIHKVLFFVILVPNNPIVYL